MSKTNFSKIVSDIINAKPPKGKAAYTYTMIKDKTGVCESTLSRLVTKKTKTLDYDSGVLILKMHNELKKSGKIK